MADVAHIAERIEAHFARTKRSAEGAELVVHGCPDSLEALSLVIFLETEFGIRVERDDLTAELGSVGSIAGFVARKLAAGACERA